MELCCEAVWWSCVVELRSGAVWSSGGALVEMCGGAVL